MGKIYKIAIHRLLKWGVVVWGPTFWTHSLDTLFGHTFSPLTLYTVSVIGFLASEYSLAI